MSSATISYLEKYFECMDSLPQELQRHISQLREIDFRTREFDSQLNTAVTVLDLAVKSGCVTEQQKALHQLSKLMLIFREAGDDKSEITSQMLDNTEEHHQQLQLRAKELETPRPLEDVLNHNLLRHSSVLPVETSADKNQYKRVGQSYKRPRLPDKPLEEETVKELHVLQNSLGALGPSKSNKKKVKVNKKSNGSGSRSAKDSSSNSFVPAPMPDLSSAPIDPNEPTYCLCRQVSFGEMIGCDNEDCPIEWFHFQCVGLTSKPKGRWYCPPCCQERRGKFK
ncbi:hypothetical protein EMCRGX_G018808 [Ephydatia muelleri]|eukprot:Em0012g1097a